MALVRLSCRLLNSHVGPAAPAVALAGRCRARYSSDTTASAASPIFAVAGGDAAQDDATAAGPKKGKWQRGPRFRVSGNIPARTQKYQTPNFRVSPKKLNKLAQQIRGLPIDEAISQMHFSHKKPRIKVRNMLYNAKATAVNVSKLNADQLYVKEAYIGKGRYQKSMLFHGRGRFGIMTRKVAHMKVLLEERTPLVQKYYFYKTLKKMLKKRAKNSPDANLDLKPARSIPLFAKEIRLRRA
ncbi:ribosomal protein L22/L17 [Hyaloraphidium curvatum]|nr:ribosomal protein L22/L17 [Hyaloraphidium curvatum]